MLSVAVIKISITLPEVVMKVQWKVVCQSNFMSLISKLSLLVSFAVCCLSWGGGGVGICQLSLITYKV